jgi:hypothetical protein
MEETQHCDESLGSMHISSDISEILRNVGEFSSGASAPYSDDEIWVARLVAGGKEAEKSAEMESPPAPIQMKDAAFSLASQGRSQ